MIDVEKVIREYIDKTVHLSLATVSDNRPWVCEVHFAYNNELNLYFVSKLTTRHCREIAANPSVAGNIVKQHGLEESPNGVYFEGLAEIVEKPTNEELDNYCLRHNRNREGLADKLKEENGGRM